MADDKLPENLAEIFGYLDDLRASGATNMYGAGAYLENEFALDRRTARAALSAWMNTFGDGGTPAAERAAKALA